ncbi:MAG: hypothetical protein ACLP9C_00785 [Acidimicrobiales bacterium]
MPEPPHRPVLTIHRSAQLLGGYRWIEHRLFELTGAWAAQAPVPEIQLYLDETSARHAWRAQLWADRLPVLDGLDPDALTVPFGPAVPPLFEALASDVAEGVVQRLAGLCRVVLPRLAVTYGTHLARAVPVTDGPVIRVLRLARRDVVESWLAGEDVLERLLRRPHDAQVAATAQGVLEGLVVAADVGTGLVPWPDETPPGHRAPGPGLPDLPGLPGPDDDPGGLEP